MEHWRHISCISKNLCLGVYPCSCCQVCEPVSGTLPCSSSGPPPQNDPTRGTRDLDVAGIRRAPILTRPTDEQWCKSGWWRAQKRAACSSSQDDQDSDQERDRSSPAGTQAFGGTESWNRSHSLQHALTHETDKRARPSRDRHHFQCQFILNHMY